MSIQIIVCTPRYFFSEFVGSEDSLLESKHFCCHLKSELNICLDHKLSCEFFMEDIDPGSEWKIKEILYFSWKEEEEGVKIAHMTGASLYIPCDSFTSAKVSLPNYLPGKDVLVVSTKTFLEAISQIEIMVLPLIDSKDLSGCQAVLETYRKAINISEKEKQPIFLSC